MSSGPLRQQVLSLYRRCLRLGRTWTAKQPDQTEVERDFIREEARTLFRANRAAAGEDRVRAHIKEAEARITMAEHYRNPYPRPVNLPPRSYTKKEGRRDGKAIKKLNEMSKPIYVKSIDSSTEKAETNGK